MRKQRKRVVLLDQICCGIASSALCLAVAVNFIASLTSREFLVISFAVACRFVYLSGLLDRGLRGMVILDNLFAS